MAAAVASGSPGSLGPQNAIGIQELEADGNLGTFFHHKWEPHDFFLNMKVKKRNKKEENKRKEMETISYCWH